MCLFFFAFAGTFLAHKKAAIALRALLEMEVFIIDTIF